MSEPDKHCRFGPDTADQQPAWLKQLQDDRTATLERIGWVGGIYDNANLKWTQTSYIQPQSHPYDRFFYDSEKHEFTVTRFLDDLNLRYGGIDSVLVWPTYPHTGIDDRNQFDFFRALPGGIEGFAKAVEELHKAGVKVLQPNKPWDTGTHREPVDNAETLATLLKQTGTDGINGDTMNHFEKEFWDASLAVDHPVALEPEGGGNDEALNWSTMGWGYWPNQKIPVVDRFKFITRGKFLTNVCDRWNKDHTDNLQFAWFNGDGFESWENVWGTWNGITDRGGEAIRRVAAMERFFGGKGFLQSPDWEPHALGLTNPTDVFASKWPLNGSVLWTLVNRGDNDLTGSQLTIALEDNTKYYDCYHGHALHPDENGALFFHIEQGGFGCVLEVPDDSSAEYTEFLTSMKELTSTKLASHDNTWDYLKQDMVEIPKVGLVTNAPDGTVFVKKDWFTFVTAGVEIEGGDDDRGVDVQFPWEDHPTRSHSHVMQLGPFHIDKFPVTAAKYSAYLKDSGYQPNDSYNWLKTWNGSSVPPVQVSELPVTYVSLNEARAYCEWAGGRLPHSYEWQYAAQGSDGRKYPWGNDLTQDNYPVLTTGETYAGPEPVTAHSPAGDSPFGMSDVVGNVWQYTDEFQDSHTRSVILRGGSNYRPSGSKWYFPQALELDKHEKYMLMDESYERAGTVGFRCLVDAADEHAVVV